MSRFRTRPAPAPGPGLRRRDTLRLLGLGARSEEHTSELQSLA